MNNKKIINLKSNIPTDLPITKTELDLIPIDEVLAKGTLFKNLYEPYKIIPRRPEAETEQETLMQELQTYAIAGMDLNLYLDVNPTDREAIMLINMINERARETVKQYEQKFGPININSDALKGFPWTWIMSRWPWEGSEQ